MAAEVDLSWSLSVAAINCPDKGSSSDKGFILVYSSRGLESIMKVKMGERDKEVMVNMKQLVTLYGYLGR